MYGDAIRNITGSVEAIAETFDFSGITRGAFKKTRGYPGAVTPVGGDVSGSGKFDFDSSLVVPTASENRVYTVNVVYYIKAK